jgi:uncharacterized repeat protein (TIGR04052 family)
VTIPFVAIHDGSAAACDSARNGWQMNDLRFYVSNVVLLDAHGAVTPLTLESDEAWQTRDLALIDLEDGSGACRNGTTHTNAELRGHAPAGDYVGIRFEVGVPFELNHADPLAADAPLDDAAMHWHWRSGYKFLRAGVSGDDDGFWLHLGSAGCKGTVQDISGCAFPNRVTVEIAEFTVGSDRIAFYFDELLRDTALDDSAASDCSSGPAESACPPPFAALGLDHSSGETTGPQTVFRIAPR